MRRELARVVRLALDEDLGWGDVTTDALISPDVRGRAVVLMKQDGVLAGLDAILETFAQVDPSLAVDLLGRDGDLVRDRQEVAIVRGAAASILKGERVALNLLQRLCGIATAARRYVDAVAGTGAHIVDTRKTTPGLRAIEKYAVRVGGASNHRMNLSDGVLIKDNHLAALGGDIGEAIRRARAYAPHTIRVEIEVVTVEQAACAAEAGADIILLDNMPPETMQKAVRVVAGRALTEASGGIRLDTVRAAAESGVDLISVGALTHSTPALDISLELILE